MTCARPCLFGSIKNYRKITVLTLKLSTLKFSSPWSRISLPNPFFKNHASCVNWKYLDNKYNSNKLSSSNSVDDTFRWWNNRSWLVNVLLMCLYGWSAGECWGKHIDTRKNILRFLKDLRFSFKYMVTHTNRHGYPAKCRKYRLGLRLAIKYRIKINKEY